MAIPIIRRGAKLGVGWGNTRKGERHLAQALQVPVGRHETHLAALGVIRDPLHIVPHWDGGVLGSMEDGGPVPALAGFLHTGAGQWLWMAL